MFRIGFDPILEAEQRQAEIIKNVQGSRLARLAEECSKHKTPYSFKLLALLGKTMADLGTNLALRYGENVEATTDLKQQSISGNCG